MEVTHSNQHFLTSSIGKKYLVAVSAIFWTLFVMMHMAGNMLIFLGAETYNKYSFALTSNPLIYLAEIVLAVLLLVHAFTALSLKFRNMQSKPTLYAVAPTNKAKGSSFSSRSMAYTGSFVLAFIIWHLATFKFGTHYNVTYNGVEMRDIYKLVVERFHDPIYVASYCLVMILIGIHLFHGVKSIFQSLGINHPRYNKFIKCLGYTYAIVVSLGFLSQPIYVYLAR